MLEAWKEVVVFVKKKGKSNLSIALSMFPVELKEGFLIDLPLSNSSQLEILNEEKSMILDFLRKKLDNDYIDIRPKVVDVKKSNVPYTNKDKFKKLLKEYPALEGLQKKLALDPDY